MTGCRGIFFYIMVNRKNKKRDFKKILKTFTLGCIMVGGFFVLSRMDASRSVFEAAAFFGETYLPLEREGLQGKVMGIFENLLNEGEHVSFFEESGEKKRDFHIAAIQTLDAAWKTANCAAVECTVTPGTFAGDDIVIDGITVNMTGDFTGANGFASLTLQNAAILTHTISDSSTTYKKMDIVLTGNLTVNAGTFIDANGKGCPASKRFNKTTFICSELADAQGSHGGAGNDVGIADIEDRVYDFIDNPLYPGSGASDATAGGGVIRISAGGNMVVNGTIRANRGSGNAAGGAIKLVATGSFTGTGTVEARTDTGTGGGGRIFIQGTTDNSLTTLNAFSWSAGAAKIGTGGGTVFLRNTTSDTNSITYHSGLAVGSLLIKSSMFATINPNTVNLSISFGHVNLEGAITFKNVTMIDTGGANNSLTHLPSTATVTRKMDLTVVQTLTVNTNGTVTGDGRGCPIGARFNPDSGDLKCSLAADSEGSHGGVGVSITEANALSRIYDYIDDPQYPGSGSATSAGDGVIKITAANIVASGTIRAGTGSGSGAGGSIKLIVSGTLSGAGEITVRTAASGTGGAGRLYIEAATITHTGLRTAYANMNPGGGGGSVLVRNTTASTYTMDMHTGNGNAYATYTPSMFSALNSNLVDLNINFGIIKLPSAITFKTVHVVSSGGFSKLSHFASTATQTNKLDLTVVNDLTVDSGEFIDANGLGCPSTTRFNPSSAGGDNKCSLAADSEGSHGGVGVSITEANALSRIYDYIDDPQYPGSGSATSAGDGVIKITAANIVASGTIRAGTGSGSGAGGSIKLIVSGTLSGAGEITVRTAASGTGGAGRLYIEAATITHTGLRTAYANMNPGGGGGSVLVRNTTASTYTMDMHTGNGNAYATYTPSMFSALNSNLVDLNINFGIIKLPSAITFKTVHVVSSGGFSKLSHFASTATQTNKLDLTVVNDLTVDSGEFIDANGLGCPGATRFNPSLSDLKCSLAADTYGSHGAAGHSVATADIIDRTYDFIDDPSYPGSGSAAGAAGGGVIRISAGGNIVVNGTIRANRGSGDAAGGAIKLVATGSFTGTGTVEARTDTGGGGGGRIFIQGTTDNALTTLNAFSWSSGTDKAGTGGGTVLLRNTTTDTNSITYHSGLASGSIMIKSSMFATINPNTVNLAVSFGYVNLEGAITFKNVTINDPGGVGNNALTHLPSTSTVTRKLDLTVVNALTVNTNGLIDVNARGCPTARLNTANGLCDSVADTNGSHGGTGSGASGTRVYDSVENPTLPGSGGTSGNGGGIVNISATNITVSGGIRADGSGNGAGGTVKLLTSSGTITGAGTVTAGGAGNGGGGRVAIIYNAANTALGLTPSNITANGAGGGSAGTAYIDTIGSTLTSTSGTLGTTDITFNHRLFTEDTGFTNSYDITPEFSTDSGVTWTTATDGGGASEGKVGLTATAGTGTAHVFVWDASAQCSGCASALLRMRAKKNPIGDGFQIVLSGTGSGGVYATVTTPSGSQSGTIPISYTLSDVGSASTSINIEYSTNGGSTWSAATSAGGDSCRATSGSSVPCTISQTTTPNGTPSKTFQWASMTDAPNTDNSLIRIRVTPLNGGSVAGETGNFRVDNNNAPVATVTNLTSCGAVNGNITITYSLVDANSDSLSIVAQYSTDNGSSWNTATSGGGDGTSGLASSVAGVSHTFIWASATNLPSTVNSTMKFRITPSDALNGAGTAGTTNTFKLNNNNPASATITTPTSASGSSVVMNYKLIDTVVGTANITPKYSLDGGTTFVSPLTEDTAATSPASQGVTSLSTALTPGADHVYVWNTGVDFTSSQQNLIFAIEPNDGNIGVCGQTSSFNYTKGGSIPVVPSAPSGPVIGVPTPLSGSVIRWNFTDTASNETGFILEDANGNKVLDTLPNATSDLSFLEETGLKANTKYTRRVKSFNVVGSSSASNTATVYTLAEVPKGVQPIQVSDREIEIQVDGVIDVSQAQAAGYTITADVEQITEGDVLKQVQDYRGQTAYFYEAVNTSNGNIQTSGWLQKSFYKFSNLTPNTVYEFRVKTRNGDGLETVYSFKLPVKTQQINPPRMVIALNVGVIPSQQSVVSAQLGQIPEAQAAEEVVDAQLSNARETVKRAKVSGYAFQKEWGKILFIILGMVLCGLLYGVLHSMRILIKNAGLLSGRRKYTWWQKMKLVMKFKKQIVTGNPVEVFESVAKRHKNGTFFSSFGVHRRHHRLVHAWVGIASVVVMAEGILGIMFLKQGTYAQQVYADNGEEVIPGDTIVYQIQYKNVGSAKATGVVITNPISSKVGYVSGSRVQDGQNVGDGGTTAGGASVWTIGNVNVNQIGYVEFKIQLPSNVGTPGILINQASVNYAEGFNTVFSNLVMNPLNPPLDPNNPNARRAGIAVTSKYFGITESGIERSVIPPSQLPISPLPTEPCKENCPPQPEVPSEEAPPTEEVPQERVIETPVGVDIVEAPKPQTVAEVPPEPVSPPSEEAGKKPGSEPGTQPGGEGPVGGYPQGQTTFENGGIGVGELPQDATAEEQALIEEGFSITGSIDAGSEGFTMSGTATPGSEVYVTFGEYGTFRVQSDENGNWKLYVPYDEIAITSEEAQKRKSVAVTAELRKGRLRSERVTLGNASLEGLVRWKEISIPEEQSLVQITAQEAVRILKESALAVKENIQKVEKPSQVALIAIAPVVTLLNPAIAANIPHIWAYLYHFISWLLSVLGIKKKKQPWGVVYDSITKEPVSLAIVRLYSVDTATPNAKPRLISTTVTDGQGRLGFLVKEGRYRLEVQKQGYAGISKLIPAGTRADAGYEDLYLGGALTLGREGVTIRVNIPIDPTDVKEEKLAMSVLGNIWYEMKAAIRKVSGPVLWIGLTGSVLLTYGSFNLTNTVILWLYVMFGLAQKVFSPKALRSWGVVYDAATRMPIALAVINIIDAEYGKLLKSRLTDYEGRYHFLPKAGKYQLQVKKTGYEPLSEAKALRSDHPVYKANQVLDIKKDEAIVNVDVAMKKQSVL